MTTYAVELYVPGTTTPVTVIHGCAMIDGNISRPINAQEGVVYGSFLDADGKKISYAGFGVIAREE